VEDTIVRPFVDGRDEAAWVDVWNRLYAGLPETAPLTRDQYDVERSAPTFSAEGRFVAERGGQIVGWVHARVSAPAPEADGSLRGPMVLPECQRAGVDTLLLGRALGSFRARGIKVVGARIREEDAALRALLDRHGFKLSRLYSLMRRDLAELPSRVGENPDVEIRELGFDDDDMRLGVNLMNETMAEHHNYRAISPEEARYTHTATVKRGGGMFVHMALVAQEPAGIVISWIDPEENEALNRKRGSIGPLGVLRRFRHQGIGKALMLRGMRTLKEQDMEEAELGVDDTNPVKALRLYQQLGFAVVRKTLHLELTL
jgi:ribosomal protein S18 acetylase RimI-like enzyme